MKSRPLTPRQERFVAEYLVDVNGTQAAIRAGYAVAGAEVTASKLLRVPKVASAVQAAMRARAERVQVTADEVLAGLKRLAFFDIADAYGEQNTLKAVREMPRDVRDALTGSEVHHDGADQVGFTVKLKLSPRIEALVALGKHLKLFTEKHEHELAGPGWAELVEAALTPKPGSSP